MVAQHLAAGCIDKSVVAISVHVENLDSLDRTPRRNATMTTMRTRVRTALATSGREPARAIRQARTRKDNAIDYCSFEQAIQDRDAAESPQRNRLWPMELPPLVSTRRCALHWLGPRSVPNRPDSCTAHGSRDSTPLSFIRLTLY